MKRLLACGITLPLVAACCWQTDDQGYKMKEKGSVTFSKDVAPILAAKCVQCHYQGGPAPFALTTYEAAKQRSLLITVITGSNEMPPCNARSNYGLFGICEPVTSDEFLKLKQWNLDGSPPGDLSFRISAPGGEWMGSTPDQVFDLGSPIPIPADGPPVTRQFSIKLPPGLGGTVSGLEISRKSESIARTANLVIGGVELESGLGYCRLATKRGVGVPAKPGETVRIEVRFHPSGKAEPCKVRIGLFGSQSKPTETLSALSIRAPKSKISAGVQNFKLESAAILRSPIQLLSVHPDATSLCSEVRADVIEPGKPARLLFQIAKWDPNNLGAYNFGRPVRLPKGSLIRSTWTFDNTTRNPRNPNTPPKDIEAAPSINLTTIKPT